jgi:hypothetical protein
MEPDRRYRADELRAFVPDAGVERLREIMHELWVEREVERVGEADWRRHRSASSDAPRTATGEIEPVQPDDLFDHGAFADFFK